MDWYSAWAEKHCTIFGMTSEADLKTVLSWEPILCVVGDSDTLAAATSWLAANIGVTNEYRFIGRLPGHLAAVQRALREVMAVAAMTPADDRHGICIVCNSTGKVMVPRLESVRNGEWMPTSSRVGRAAYQSYLVLCCCALGHWLANNRKPNEDQTYVSLEQYERRNPRWKIQMEKRAEESRQEVLLTVPDKGWARVIDSLTAKFKEHF